MNQDMRLWKNFQTVRLLSLDSLSVSAWSWLQRVPGDLCKVLESSNWFERAWNVENCFQIFLSFLELAMASAAAFAPVRHQGWLQYLYGNGIKVKVCPKIHGFMISIFDFNQIFLHIFDWQNLLKLDFWSPWLIHEIFSMCWVYLHHKKIWKPYLLCTNLNLWSLT